LFVAIVTLVHGEEAEEIVTDRVDCKLLDTVVEVSIHPTENLLCIAHLPFDMGDKKFIELVAQYGAIERAFLMRSSGGLYYRTLFVISSMLGANVVWGV